jgi:hypothetical protein
MLQYSYQPEHTGTYTPSEKQYLIIKYMEINFIAVAVAAVAAFMIGFLIHGVIFEKLWMKLADMHPTGEEKFSDMLPQMFWNLFANFVTASILAMFIFATSSFYGNGGSVLGGMGIAFWAWLGFVVTSTSMEVIWMKKSKKLWLFDICAALVAYLAMGAILAWW